MTTPPDDKTLADGLRQGDSRVFTEVVRRYSRLVLHKARLLLQDSGAAEDAAQEVFIKAFRARHTLRGDRIMAWLNTITYHHCLDVHRRGTCRPQHVSFSEELAGADDPRLEDPSALLQSLNPTERAVVTFRVLDSLDYQEISQITGLAEGTLRNMLSRCLKKLRQERDAPGGSTGDASEKVCDDEL